MLKKLTEEQRNMILTCAIEEFGEQGYGRAKITSIARSAGLSAGVIYKYYEDKEALFNACLEHCMDYLEDVYTRLGSTTIGLEDGLERLVELAVIASREHPEYFRLYHQITLTQNSEEAVKLSSRIEGSSSKLYVSFLEDGVRAGLVREDMDPKFFALLFDDILMMINFSLSSKYYEERMRLYLGHDPSDAELKEQILKFVRGAFGMGE
ncbi:MAG: TetR/AcrR family transcriptional regulator [Firmicutes bacterium]|nr:TetR/AcrR family transcriptional regulator [Bacillota bacterium]MBQ2305054.1 TetR/AcrR family transcriptional regulator [Bacillota bacterium]MBR2749146.1 TetR/AcrR family transcriptional regulator [Bacillota bacterium]